MHVYDGVRRVSGLRREPVVVSVINPTLIPTSHWKRWSRPCCDRLRPSRCEFCAGFLCTELAKHPQRIRNERVEVCHNRVGIIFLSWGWGLVWGSSRRLQVFYVIPGSSVFRHMNSYAGFWRQDFGYHDSSSGVSLPATYHLWIG